MRSADESETSKGVKSEGRTENQQQGEAAVIPLYSNSGISVPASSIASITTALISNAIPLTVLQNALSLSAPLIVPPSTFQNVNPSLLEFKGQASQILPNDLGLRLVTDSSFKPPVVLGLPQSSSVGAVTMPIKRETNDNDYTDSDDDDDESSSNQEWTSPPGGSLGHSDESAVDYSVTASSYSSSSTASTAGSKLGSKKMRTSSGPRRSAKDMKLTPEEEERRKVRRERNKLAAAKCRQKRVDQTNQLLTETQQLEEEQTRLEEEIKKYQQQKEELEFILDAHRVHCGLGKQPPPAPSLPQPLPPNPAAAASAAVSLPPVTLTPPVIKAESSDDKTGGETKSQAGVASVQGARLVSFLQRPTSFPVASRSVGSALSAVTQTLGIPISTPSSGIIFAIGLDSMLDGHTGLTPITGVPSIVAQTPQNPASDAAQPPSDALTPASSNALMSL